MHQLPKKRSYVKFSRRSGCLDSSSLPSHCYGYPNVPIEVNLKCITVASEHVKHVTQSLIYFAKVTKHITENVNCVWLCDISSNYCGCLCENHSMYALGSNNNCCAGTQVFCVSEWQPHLWLHAHQFRVLHTYALDNKFSMSLVCVAVRTLSIP